MTETSTIYTNVPQKGLITDLHENLVSKELWTFLRNGQMNSHLGQIQFIQNEPSNFKCVDLPYTPIGFVKLLEDRWLVFTTDNINSEIGIFRENSCIYEKLVNNICLGFSLDYPIQGVFKRNHDCTETVYFTDKNNPRRRINLQNIPYTYTIGNDGCDSKIFTDQLNCDELLVDKLTTVPCITSRLSVGGNLMNGSYQFAIAYSVNSSKISDYYSITRPQRIWSHENRGQAIDITIENLDRDFDQYELIAIYTVDNVTHYKSFGFYSTSVSTHHISSVDRSEFVDISLLELLTKYPRYSNADLIVANDQYLLWAGVTTSPEINYQKDAMNIQAEYVVYEVPQNYYANGGQLVGYCRDEVYPFGIQWLSSNGEWSAVFHIPGRLGQSETGYASGGNVYETRSSSCDPQLPRKFQVENSAGNMITETNIAKCSEKIIGTGKMAYVESTDVYPDNKITFGKYACAPIRHHKFPDNCNTHIYSNNGETINILGIRFKNIVHPKDKNGKELTNIVGYRIVRGSREGNRTVVAKGICTNMRSYVDNDLTVLYPNYPYNDLRADNFLSSKPTYRKGSSERDFRALTGFEKDKFSFYSPHTLFGNIGLGEEINFLTEEIAMSEGQFEKPWKHPKQKLVTEFDLYFALIIGAIDGFLSTRGKRCVVKYVNPTRASEELEGILQLQKPKIVTEVGSTSTSSLEIVGTTALVAGNSPLTGTTSLRQLTHYTKEVADHSQLAQEQYCNDLISQLQGVIETGGKAQKILAKGLKVLASVGMFAYFALKTAQEILDQLYNFSPWQDYALQYNSKALFNNYKCFDKGNRRKHIEYYQYIYDGINTVEGFNLNNFKRANSVYIRTNDDVAVTKEEDTSRNTLTDLKMCSNIFGKVKQPAVVYYTSIKRKVPNQYGQIDSINYIDTGHCVQKLEKNKDGVYISEAIFGGDTFINKFAVKDTFNYFSQYLYDVTDGYIYDYNSFRNVGYTRYWMNSEPYDLSEAINIKPKKSNLPRNKHNLDCKGSDISLDKITVIKDAYFYIHNSSVKEFFVESDYNLDYRDWTDSERPSFYSRYNQDIKTLFKSGENIEKREEFRYDQSLSKQLLENSIYPQRVDYDPAIDETCYQYMPNKIIYSLPSSSEQRGDNWQINLLNNFYDFPASDFGNLTSMHSIDNQQIMFLFDKSAPYVTIGRDELQLDGSGKKITLGDGGLFAREPRPIAYTDYGYGNSQSKWAFVNTQFGSFYPSQRQGRVFNFTGKMEEISRNGNHWWFKQYLPSYLLEQFPEFKNKDNPIAGVGLLSVFDNTDERYYLTKRDYSLKPEFRKDVKYNLETNTFTLNNRQISLKDPLYFEDASWTISYSPKDQSFISYHDWHPDWTLQSENHFLTTKNNSIWKHNNRYDSFCNFYGVQYPFSIEYIVNNGQTVDILRSIEYYLEVGKYSNEGRNFTHILDENFDYLTISNSEQISGNSHLNLQKKNSFADSFNYPKIDSANNKIEILFSKEEQKYRVNQFWDITKDRGEFSMFNYPLWIMASNGYIKDINLAAVDYNKKDWERKKFRSMWHRVLLTKANSEDKKLIFKFSNTKENQSFR